MKNADEIGSIRMSTLVEVVKKIIGGECNINLLDYSCNSATRSLPPQDKANMKYLVKPDIESGESRSWGGKAKKNRKTIKRKKTIRRSKKSKTKK